MTTAAAIAAARQRSGEAAVVAGRSLTTAAAIAAVAISLAACAGGGKLVRMPAPARARAGARGARALWQLAPRRTAFGIVIAGGAGNKLASAVTEMARVMRARPLGAILIGALESTLAGAGIDRLDAGAWRKAGIDLSGGAAMFFDAQLHGVLVLPVVDRGAFRKLTGGHIETIAGVEYDHIADMDCRRIRGYYVCTEKAAPATPNAGAPGALATFAAHLPRKLRGDIEVVADLSRFPAAPTETRALAPALTAIRHLVVAARIGGGRLSVRGWLEGKRGPMFAGVPRMGAPSRLIPGADGVLALRVPPALLRTGASSLPSVPGLDLKRDLVDNLTGELVSVTKGAGLVAGQIALGLSNRTRLADKLGVVCGLAARLPQLSVAMNDGRCTGTVSVQRDPAAGLPQLGKLIGRLDVALAVEDGRVTLSFGAPPAPSGAPGDLAGGPTSRELLTTDWQELVWARSLDPLAGLPARTAEQIFALAKSKAPAKLIAGLSLARWLVAHVYDVGAGLSFREDGLHFLVAANSFAADPPAVYKQYEAAVAKSMRGDFAGYRRALAAIAEQHPNTLAGRQAKAVARGVPAFGIGTALLEAGVAIPAFMQYVRKAKQAQP